MYRSYARALHPARLLARWGTQLDHPDFRLGFRHEAELMAGMLAWGVVAGVTMVKAGLSVPLALAMSLLVYSAGAQLGALTLMAAGTPLWIVVSTASCMNLRFVIFSAALRPYLLHLPFWRRTLLGYFTADLSYVVFMRRYGESPLPAAGQVHYLSGCCAANWLGWQAASVVGIVFATQIPVAWGLGFAGVLALLGIACSLIKSWLGAASAVTAFVVAIAARGLPLRLNIVLAIACAVAVGMAGEQLQSARPRAAS